MVPEDTRLRVAVLGMGRLGRSMTLQLRRAGHEALTWGRGMPLPDADVYWLTVSDRAIAEVASLVPRDRVVLHASGATDLTPLAAHAEHGSLHPLQSFPGPEVAMPPVEGVPAAIAGTPRAMDLARQLALDIGFEAFEVPGDRRLYHAAAVMAGNFATSLLHAASQALAEAGVPESEAPRLLAPLAIASIRQAAERGCAEALTGPYKRGDRAVVRDHIAAIDASTPDIADLYRELGKRTWALSGLRDEEGV